MDKERTKKKRPDEKAARACQGASSCAMTPMQGQPCAARYAAHEATYESCAALSSESLDGWMDGET